MRGLLTFRLILLFVVMLIGGIALIFISAKNGAEFNKEHEDFNNMRASDFREGQIVEGKVGFLFDEFCQTTEDGKVTEEYFIMPLEATTGTSDVEFVGICVRNASLRSTASKMVDQYYDYVVNDEEPAVWSSFDLVGRVRKMDKEEEGYFYQCMDADGFTREELKGRVALYVIGEYKGGSEGVGIVVGIIMVVISIPMLIFMVIRKLNGR